MRWRPLALLVVALLLGSFFAGYRAADSRARERQLAAGQPVVVLEEAPFLVPEGHELVLTSLGSRIGSFTSVGVQVDGEEVCSGDLPSSGLVEDRLPIAVVIPPGRRVRVYGGLTRGDDADAWGQLVPQAGWTRRSVRDDR